MARQSALAHDPDRTMSQPPSSRKRSSTSGRSDSARSDSTRKSRSSYDSNFKQNLIDGGIYPEGYELDDTNEARNLDAIHEALPVPRASLSPSRFSDGAFKEFRRTNDRAAGETRVIADVLTIIEGKGRHKHHNGGPDHPFNHLQPFTKYLPIAKPDTYDGALPAQIDRRVRRDLGRHIVPCNDSSRPAAPNFFIEGKSASGRADVAKLQACHDGAIGERAMDSLQNYGASKPQYDGNIKSFSTSYHPGTGTLQLYGHHTTPPQVPGGHPEYHMTQIKGYMMTSDRETFQKGATAFRNLRDLAQTRRDELIDRANRATRHAPTESLSTTFTDSRTSLSVLHESEPDTSADELAIEETTIKRTRHLPRAQSRHDSITSRYSIKSTSNISPSPSARPRHTVDNPVTSRHTMPRSGNVAASHPTARSRHVFGDAAEEPRRRVRPLQEE